ncbi:ATP-binding protein [Flavitalea antarctica]
MQPDPTYLTALFEYATEGIILTNGGGNIVLINPAAQRMFGYPAQDVIGKPIETLLRRKVRNDHAHMPKPFYKDYPDRIMGPGQDLHGRRNDGTELPLEVSIGFYEKDKERFVIVFVVDVTTWKNIEINLQAQQSELQNMAMAMQRLNEELQMRVEERTKILKEALEKLEESRKELDDAFKKEEQLNELKKSFVSLASHEFRTPLSTILSSAALVGHYTDPADQDKREKHIKRIKDSVKHLNQILEDFLSLGKLEDGKIKPQPEIVDVDELLSQLLNELTGAEKPGQKLLLENASSGKFCTDKTMLRNILINLIGNAIKFSDANAQINISAKMLSHRLAISVSDQGIGISPTDQPLLFTNFFRGKNATNIQGLGLGLHIVKKYIELLGGDIRVKSELNRGTTFECTFPDLNFSKQIRQ